MTVKIRVFVQVIVSLLIFPLAQGAESVHSGYINFPTSAPQNAQTHFLNGLYYLHNFAWQHARDEFLIAQELFPDYAMAYWGEALTFNHPLFPARDLDSPARALEKLHRETNKRLDKAPSAVEKGFLKAAEAYAFTTGSTADRNEAYFRAMRSLYEAFPNHTEVRAFYALAMLGVASQQVSDQSTQLRQQAGHIANALFMENNQHTGAAHYLIHAYDDPKNAAQAVRAANIYAEIAHALPHARHMPSHIYAHLGRWYEVADLNETAYYNAKAMWLPGDDPQEQNHAMEFGQYGDLQLANYDTALQWIERGIDTLAQNPDDESTAQTVGRLNARFIVESKRWQFMPVDNTKTSEELFAAGLSAVNMRDFTSAREINQMLKERFQKNSLDVQLGILQLELEASLLFAAGDLETSLQLLVEATELDAELPDIDPLPNVMKPVYELKGEILLRSGKPEEAIEAFLLSLDNAPYRPWSELGLARSYATLGRNLEASKYYRQLLRSWGDNSLLGVSEAKTHLGLYPITEFPDF